MFKVKNVAKSCFFPEVVFFRLKLVFFQLLILSVDVQQTYDGRPSEIRRTSIGRPTDVRRTSNGSSGELRRMSVGRLRLCPSDVRPSDFCWNWKSPSDVRSRRTSIGRLSHICRTSVGRPLDACRTSIRQTSFGRLTDVRRMSNRRL